MRDSNSGSVHGPGRVLVVKLIFTDGTMQDCNGGNPASVIALRQGEVTRGTIEGLRVNRVVPAHEQSGDLVSAVELNGRGVGGATAPPPPQPNVHAHAPRRARNPTRVLPKSSAMLCGRGRIPCAKQAKGQRNSQGTRVSDLVDREKQVLTELVRNE